jgi:hypothetical protein
MEQETKDLMLIVANELTDIVDIARSVEFSPYVYKGGLPSVQIYTSFSSSNVLKVQGTLNEPAVVTEWGGLQVDKEFESFHLSVNFI